MTLAAADRAIDALPLADGHAAGVPVVDLAADAGTVRDAVAAACRDWGMFIVSGHGIAADLRRDCLGAMRGFFAQIVPAKQRLSRSLDNPWGYYDRELTKNALDAKEVFDIGPEEAADAGADPFSGSTPWPDDAAFVATMRTMMAACETLADRLVRIAFADLGEPPDALVDAFRPMPTSFMRLNHYPAPDAIAASPVPGRAVHHHSDAGAITVLMEDGVPGLQVLHADRWHTVAPPPGALVINIGDMMQVWSNDQYRAPVHRVLAMTTRERFSVPFFHNPSYRALIAPLPRIAERTGGARYRPIAWAEFRRLRADGDYGDFGREVQIGDYAITPRPA